MPLIQPADSHLPHIDAAPSASAISAARASIEAELDPSATSTLHPSIPASREPECSPAIRAEHERLAVGAPTEPSVDLSRYEALDAPAKGDLITWRTTLEKAYASHEYLRGREVNLSLLETYGKNAWLIGNSQLEDELKALERDVEAAKLEQEAVEQARRAVQENARGEMAMLDQGWREGVGRMIEAQAAGEALRQQILERKREGAR